jgi:hypothetical protein
VPPFPAFGRPIDDETAAFTCRARACPADADGMVRCRGAQRERVTRAAVIFNPETASIATSGVPPVTAVPEPSTWAMLLIGFAGLGFAGQPRRKAPFA